MQTAGKAFKGIFGLWKFRELKDNTYQDTQLQQPNKKIDFHMFLYLFMEL